MRIIIVEGGLAGLHLAFLLREQQHEVTVFHTLSHIQTSFYSSRQGPFHYEFGFPFFLSSHSLLCSLCEKLELQGLLQLSLPTFGVLSGEKLSPFSLPFQAPLHLSLDWLAAFLKDRFHPGSAAFSFPMLSPFFGRDEITFAELSSFFQKPQLSLRYGMDTIVEKLIARGDFLLECARVAFQKDDERKRVIALHVRPPSSSQSHISLADVFFVGAPTCFPFVVVCATASGDIPYDNIFVLPHESGVSGMVTRLNNYFPYWLEKRSVLRFVVCTQDQHFALQSIEHWANSLGLRELSDVKSALYNFTLPPYPLDKEYENVFRIPSHFLPEEEIAVALTLSKKVRA